MEIENPVKISKNPPLFSFSELWKSRELLYFFIWKNIKVKYKQTVLGILWVILQPLLLMFLFYHVFANSLKHNVNIAYPIFLFAGLSLWGLFSSGITNNSESLLGNAQIIKKIYFPRIILPITGVLMAVMDFFIVSFFLIILLFFYKHGVGIQILFCIPAIILTILSSFGIGSILAALNLKYRDFRYLLPFILQMLFFSSQIIYPFSLIHGNWLRLLLHLNPMNGILELFYFSLGRDEINYALVLTASICSVLLFLGGLLYFKRVEIYFADIA